MASKRKAESAGNGKDTRDPDTDSDASDYAPSAIDVSFNYVAPSAIDFAALKRLTQQLFHTHAPDLNLTALVDEILAWGDASVGTVVKVEDDEDGDPFAFASVINLANATSSSTALSKNDGSKSLLEYYQRALKTNVSSSSSSTSKAAAQSIQSILSDPSTKPLQIFHERMINLPPQIMPPLYKMLFDEIKANEELNASTHLLFFSRVFSTAAFDDDADDDDDSQVLKSSSGKGNSKKQKKAIPKNKAIAKMSSTDEAGGEKEMGLFHPEDSILAKHALNSFTYRFPPVKDSDESFNAPMYARLVLIKRDEQTLQLLLQQLEEAFAVPL